MKKLLIVGATAVAPLSALALGIRLPDQDAFATARGEAFAATADNPSAIYYNPAGISQLEGHNFRLGAYGISLSSEATSAFGPSYETESQFSAVPQFYYTFTPKESRFSFGLGVYSPYGLSLEWPQDALFRPLGTCGKIEYFSINPVISYKVLDNLFFAIGPTANYASTKLRNGLSLPPGLDYLEFSGDGWSVGFNAGLMWKITEKHVIGVNYRSETVTQFEGSSKLNLAPGVPSGSPAQARFTFPQHVVIGYSYRPTPKWNFEFNADWTDWDALNTVDLTQPFLFPVAIPFNWQSSWFYEFGATHYFDCGYRVSAGYIFSENSVPEESFRPIVPDSNRHIFSVGVGKTYENGWSWDFAYQFAYGPERTINNVPGPGLNFLANGSYEFTSHAFGLSIGKSFR
jgi:long-chain fatty acid transport protein